MENKKIRAVEELDDISSMDAYKVAIDAGISKERALETLSFFSRDNARTPMQWSGQAHAGFTSGEPWLRENPNYREINVEEQQERGDSVLSYYKELIALRKDPAYKETIVYGGFEPLPDCGHNVIAYCRTGAEQTILVAANFNLAEREIALPAAPDGGNYQTGKTLLANEGEPAAAEGILRLRGLQAAVVLLK